MDKTMPDPRTIAVDTTYEQYQLDEDDDRMTYSSGQSLASNITRYRYENGRRYHAYRDGVYYGPNDDQASTYETVVHHLWLLTLKDKLFLAPIENPQMVLDVGTGNGLWAIDMGDYFPSAEIIGTDLSPTQVTDALPNVRFEVDDASSEWTYPANSFDFVHIRGLTGCIPDWPYLYEQCFKHIKPNGFIEHLEFDVRTNADPDSDNHADQTYHKFSSCILGLGEQTGRTFRTHELMAGWMRDAGFVDVTEHKFIWPIGPWPKDPHLKELGRWGERNWADGMEGWVMALFTRVLGWSYTDVKTFVEEMKSVIKDRNNHFFHEVRVVYGRKSETPTDTSTA
jgi:ubiquinone/menaquinone biosynthesis C-methylase UbiE